MGTWGFLPACSQLLHTIENVQAFKTYASCSPSPSQALDSFLLPVTANLPEMTVCFLLPLTPHSVLPHSGRPPPWKLQSPFFLAKPVNLTSVQHLTLWPPPSPSGNCLPWALGHHPLLAFPTTPICLAPKCWYLWNLLPGQGSTPLLSISAHTQPPSPA